ncbi:MAG: PAS domain-containing sensor histidine kinase [Pseudodesulfovibrio sp.]|uniref:histidine kinase n=2 Tax=Pseudodesulfovibrio indicus TaxID=1716143 RepID=A0A126QKP5_9BACT|nr:ATP-binding protein [Pseudodesulfovibrio indicus]AMK10572.1 PAS domain-containing sensor histidine kinase [Pseudodesulfovibrio indicus]TDT89021.1 two-component system phosphate regulon sensor histidine kinase PhoR [Pseudodesulfovibrio indicus]
MKLRSFQMRILLWTWGLLLMAMAVIFFYSTSIVGDELVTEAEIRTRHQIEAIEWLIRDHPLFESEKDFAEWLDALAFKLNSRITYIVDGRVVADSEVPFADLGTLDDHSHRPEVVAALKDGWGVNSRHSDTLEKEMLYVARQFPGVPAVDEGVLRMAVPFSHVSARLNLLRSNLIWIFLSTFGAAVLLSMFMSRNMGREIRAFSELARSIGEGDYSKRLRVLPGGEFKPLAHAVNAMAQSIERNIELIKDQKGQLQAVFGGMREGVLTLDSNGRIESFNTALDDMFNIPETAVGRSPIEVIRRYEIQDLVDRVLADPSEQARSIQIDIMDTRTVEVSAERFLDQNGVRKIILVFYDITEMKRSEKSLKDFVANASHQLRTPLTSIKGYTETLLDMPPADPADGRRFLETVLKNADHMDKVISSMLALAKSEQAGKRLRLGPLSGREHLSRAIDDLAVWAGERSVTFRTRTPEDEMYVMGETDGLLHVFHNLLNNAVKYSPHGGVITVSAEDDGESIVFCVEDQGPGISREHSTKVFERFYRVDENTIDGSGSAGLGLAICRRIVKNFGGEIWHDGYGEDVRGARFCFRLNKPAEKTP